MNFQLPLHGDGGTATAFDVGNGNTLCVSFSQYLAFYRIPNPASPNHLIHIESSRVDKLKMQHFGGNDLVAGLRGGVVSVWETQSALSPIVSLLKSVVPGGSILDFSWNYESPNLLATGCSGGSVLVWDARTPSQTFPALNVGGLRVVNQVDWCPTIGNTHTFAVVSSGKRVLIFDSRKLGSQSEKDTSTSAISAFEVGGGVGNGIRSIHWLHNSYDEKSGLESTSQIGTAISASAYNGVNASPKLGIAVVTTAGKVERWDTKAVVTSVANTINASTHSLLEPPASKFVYSNVGTSGNIGLHEQAMVISTHSGTGMIALEPSESDNASTLTIYGLQTTTALTGKDSSSGLIAQIQMPFQDMLGMFWAPTGAPSTYDTDITSNSMTSTKGKELYCITRSGHLIPVHIPITLEMKVCGFPVGTNGIASSVPNSTYPVTHSQLQSMTGIKPLQTSNAQLPGISSAIVSNSFTNTSSKFGGQRLRAAPRLGMNTLKPTIPILLDGNLSLKRTVAGFENMTTQDHVTSQHVNSLTQMSTGSETALTLWDLVESEVLTIQDDVEQELLHGLSVGMIDHYARQVTLQLSLSDRNFANSTSKLEPVLDTQAGRIAATGNSHNSLQKNMSNAHSSINALNTSSIISLSLIARYPIRSAPTFSLRGVDREPGQSIARKLVAELDDLSRQADIHLKTRGQRHTQSMSLDLLPTAARLFRERCWPLLEGMLADADVARAAIAPGSPLRTGVSSTIGSVGEISMANSSQAAIIDPLAYRVPSPVRSGAIWAGTGQLVLFGEAHLQTTSLLSNKASLSPLANTEGSTILSLVLPQTTYPRTLGDMLIRQREVLDTITPNVNTTLPTVDRSIGIHPSESDSDSSSSSDDDHKMTSTGEENIYSIPLTLDIPNKSRNVSKTGSSKFEGTMGSPLLLTNKPAFARDNSGSSTLYGNSSSKLTGINPQHSTHISLLSIFYPCALPMAFADAFSLGPEEHLTVLPTRTSQNNAEDVIRAAQLLRVRIDSCKYNSEVVSTSLPGGYYPCSVVHYWKLLAIFLETCVSTLYSHHELSADGGDGIDTMNWHGSSIGAPLLQRLLVLLIKHRELQLLATVVCILGGSARTMEFLSDHHVSVKESAASTSSQERSASTAINSGYRNLAEWSQKLPALEQLLERSLISYEHILSRWGRLQLATQVRKHFNGYYVQQSSGEIIFASDSLYNPKLTTPVVQAGQPFPIASVISQAAPILCVDNMCFTCGSDVINLSISEANATTHQSELWQCQNCRSRISYCAVCHLPLRTTCLFCAGCGHGGHIGCIKNWAVVSHECATGCGCRCAHLGVAMRSAGRHDGVQRPEYVAFDSSSHSSLSDSSESSSSSSDSDSDTRDDEQISRAMSQRVFADISGANSKMHALRISLGLDSRETGDFHDISLKLESRKIEIGAQAGSWIGEVAEQDQDEDDDEQDEEEDLPDDGEERFDLYNRYFGASSTH